LVSQNPGKLHHCGLLSSRISAFHSTPTINSPWKIIEFCFVQDDSKAVGESLERLEGELREKQLAVEGQAVERLQLEAALQRVEASLEGEREAGRRMEG